jgi:hypothetical protein
MSLLNISFNILSSNKSIKRPCFAYIYNYIQENEEESNIEHIAESAIQYIKFLLSMISKDFINIRQLISDSLPDSQLFHLFTSSAFLNKSFMLEL